MHERRSLPTLTFDPPPRISPDILIPRRQEELSLSLSHLPTSASPVRDGRTAVDLRISGVREAAVRALSAQLSRRVSGVILHTNAPVPIVGNMSGLSILTCSQIVCRRSERQLWRLQT